MGLVKDLLYDLHPEYHEVDTGWERTETENGEGTRVEIRKKRVMRHEDTGEEKIINTERGQFLIFVEWDDGKTTTIEESWRSPRKSQQQTI